MQGLLIMAGPTSQSSVCVRCENFVTRQQCCASETFDVDTHGN